jgi:hypothetical protein
MLHASEAEAACAGEAYELVFGELVFGEPFMP